MISLDIFFVLPPKILISQHLRAPGYGGYGQNPEPQGLAAKIFRNKDLASDLEELFSRENSRIGQACSFRNARSRLCVTGIEILAVENCGKGFIGTSTVHRKPRREG